MSSKPTARKLRKKGLKRLLIEDGGLKSEVVQAAFSGDPVGAETMAIWLRVQLRRLKDAEKKIAEKRSAGEEYKTAIYDGEMPLANLDISITAITALEALNRRGKPSGRELASLLSDLLGVTRHRAHTAKQRYGVRGPAIFIEATEPPMGVNELERETGINRGTISKWRSDPEYHRAIKAERDYFAREAEDWMATYGADEIEDSEPE